MARLAVPRSGANGLSVTITASFAGTDFHVPATRPFNTMVGPRMRFAPSALCAGSMAALRSLYATRYSSYAGRKYIARGPRVTACVDEERQQVVPSITS